MTLERLGPVFGRTGRDRKLKSYIVCNISQIASSFVIPEVRHIIITLLTESSQYPLAAQLCGIDH